MSLLITVIGEIDLTVSLLDLRDRLIWYFKFESSSNFDLNTGIVISVSS